MKNNKHNYLYLMVKMKDGKVIQMLEAHADANEYDIVKKELYDQWYKLIKDKTVNDSEVEYTYIRYVTYDFDKV